ncbi:hypothetical protein [Helicobacter mesocricetorum]|uniref:hypothetical protein n=1 Tax=Helicobacter mesocricetorum TaxID=87012 RepID=UPI000CF07EBA|nr:hypothetical protein [Helicobacter mesocricetorum]
MLKHCIILPTDSKHFFNFKLIEQNKLLVNVIFSQEYILEDSQTCIRQFGQEIIEKSQIKDIEIKQNTPLSLSQLALLDFNQYDSYHLIGDEKQFYFLVQIMKKLGLEEVKIYFSDTNKKEDINKLENIFSLENLNNDEKIDTYIAYVLENTKEKLSNCKKYHIHTNAMMTLDKECFFALYIEEQQIIKTLLKTPQSQFIKQRKLKKLKERPFLFFKDFVLNRMRKLKCRFC